MAEKRLRIALAGLPTTIEYGSTSEPTTLFAPIIAPSPMCTPGRITAFCPIQTSLPMTVSPLRGRSLMAGGFIFQPSRV